MNVRALVIVVALLAGGCADDETAVPPTTTVPTTTVPTTTVPTTTAAPTPSTTTPTTTTPIGPITGPAADLSGEPLGPSGFASLRVGETAVELEARGVALDYADCDVPYVRFGTDGLVAVRPGIYDDNRDEPFTGLYVWIEERNRGVLTTEGIGRGATVSDVLAAYGARAVERTVDIDLSGPDHRVEVTDDASGHVMIFSFTEEGTLWLIRVGEPAAIDAPYLCA